MSSFFQTTTACPLRTHNKSLKTLCYAFQITTNNKCLYFNKVFEIYKSHPQRKRYLINKWHIISGRQSHLFIFCPILITSLPCPTPHWNCSVGGGGPANQLVINEQLWQLLLPVLLPALLLVLEDDIFAEACELGGRGRGNEEVL